MKVKHIITTCGIILGGLAVTSGTGSAISSVAKSDVQFTFNSMLELTVDGTPSGYSDPTFLIDDLAPGTSANSNVVNAKVDTNNAAGYTLSATVGDATNYNNSDLNPTTPNTDKFEMIGSSATTLSAGTWGYTLNGSAATPVYGALALHSASVPTILNKTIDMAGTAAAGYSGDTSHAGTDVQIGAYAAADQVYGAYQNVVNFKAVANPLLHTVALSGDAHTDSVDISVSGTSIGAASGSFDQGQTIGIAAVCATGYEFNGWSINYDYGSIADKTLASTNYTVGGGSVTLTAHCVLHSVSVVAGSNVASVGIVSVAGNPMTPVTTGKWGDSVVLGIEATCNSGYVFGSWTNSGANGTIASTTSASTTYTVNGGNATLTAQCVSP